jgi:hypothetical protein
VLLKPSTGDQRRILKMNPLTLNPKMTNAPRKIQSPGPAPSSVKKEQKIIDRVEASKRLLQHLHDWESRERE